MNSNPTFTLQDFQKEDFNSSDFANDYLDKCLAQIDFSALEKCDLSEVNKQIDRTLKNLDGLKEEITLEVETLNLEKELN
mmetsp:Transcript_305/g.281  ORF Transcript_305/g.281 Transcript_305/m.281 type:complete len:80 (-) Transcript_305:33-272(-)